MYLSVYVILDIKIENLKNMCNSLKNNNNKPMSCITINNILIKNNYDFQNQNKLVVRVALWGIFERRFNIWLSR